MSGTAHLRAAVTGLLGFAASEEEILLAAADDGGEEPAEILAR